MLAFKKTGAPFKILSIGLFVLIVLTLALPLLSFAQERGSIAEIEKEGIVPCNTADGCNYSTLIVGIQRFLTFFIYLAGVVAVVMFVWAGGLMLFSGGNTTKVTQAKSIFQGTIVGFIVVIAAWLIISTIIGFFGGDGSEGTFDLDEELPLKDVERTQ